MAIWYIGRVEPTLRRDPSSSQLLLDTAGLINVRILFRMMRERQREKGKDGKKPRRIVIVGAAMSVPTWSRR